MVRIKLILGLVVIGCALFLVWRIGSCELANIELRGELRDLAAQVGGHIGLDAPSSDEELRTAILRKASMHDIQLEPQQITVQRTGDGEMQTLYLAVDYTARVNLGAVSFTLHFTPSSKR